MRTETERGGEEVVWVVGGGGVHVGVFWSFHIELGENLTLAAQFFRKGLN